MEGRSLEGTGTEVTYTYTSIGPGGSGIEKDWKEVFVPKALWTENDLRGVGEVPKNSSGGGGIGQSREMEARRRLVRNRSIKITSRLKDLDSSTSSSSGGELQESEISESKSNIHERSSYTLNNSDSVPLVGVRKRSQSIETSNRLPKQHKKRGTANAGSVLRKKKLESEETESPAEALLKKYWSPRSQFQQTSSRDQANLEEEEEEKEEQNNKRKNEIMESIQSITSQTEETLDFVCFLIYRRAMRAAQEAALDPNAAKFIHAQNIIVAGNSRSSQIYYIKQAENEDKGRRDRLKAVLNIDKLQRWQDKCVKVFLPWETQSPNGGEKSKNLYLLLDTLIAKVALL